MRQEKRVSVSFFGRQRDRNIISSRNDSLLSTPCGFPPFSFPLFTQIHFPSKLLLFEILLLFFACWSQTNKVLSSQLQEDDKEEEIMKKQRCLSSSFFFSLSPRLLLFVKCSCFFLFDVSEERSLAYFLSMLLTIFCSLLICSFSSSSSLLCASVFSSTFAWCLAFSRWIIFFMSSRSRWRA